MAKEISSLRLGDLLTAAGLLKFEELQEAAHIAKNQSLPVGRVLIMSGYLSEHLLKATLKVQSLVKDDLLDYELALKSLAMLPKDNISLEQALQRLGWTQPDSMPTNKIGELLTASQLVDTMQLDLALAQSAHSGLPVGRVLVNFGLLSEALLASTLNAQIFIRDKRITREQAIKALRAAKERSVPLEQALADTGTLHLPPKPSVRLGQLLIMAGLVEEPDLMKAVELGLIKEQRLGKMLLTLNLISEQILAKALEAQALVATGVDVDQAANILTTAVNKEITIAQATSLLLGAKQAGKTEVLAQELSLHQFLQLSGLVTACDLERAIQSGVQDADIMGRMLIKAGVLEDYIIEAAIACSDLVGKRVLRTEQAIMAINHCRRTRNSIYDCFDEFGWTQPPEISKPIAGAKQSTAKADTPPRPPRPPKPANTTGVLLKLQKNALETNKQANDAESGSKSSTQTVDLNEDSADEHNPATSDHEVKPKKRLIDLVP